MAGGLHCDCNHQMKFVSSHKRNGGWTVRAHFNHVVSSANASGSGTNGGGGSSGVTPAITASIASLM